MADGVMGVRGLAVFESPDSFMRMCVRLAIALTIVGAAGLVDPIIVLPLAGLLLVFAGLAWLTTSDVLDDPDPSPLDAADSDDDVRKGAAAEEPSLPLLDPADDPVAQVDLLLLAEDAVVAQPEPADPGLVHHRFQLPTAVGAEQVWLVGDFNGWSLTDHPMQRDGEWFTTTVPLEPGRTYRYRYLLDDERWENDWAACAYVPNDHGTDDSVVTT